MNKRFKYGRAFPINSDDSLPCITDSKKDKDYFRMSDIVNVLNEQQELIEELHISDEMGWKRAEHFEKKCPKELHNKKMYIKRLEYKVQKFKEENEQLRQQLQDWDDMVELATKTSLRNVELNEQIGQLQRENEQLKHELDSLTGCYCADNKEFKDYWRIGYDD